MYRHKRKHLRQDNQHLDRWLISYADYMTLMFALFVVLYAFSLMKDDYSKIMTEQLVDIFKASEDTTKTGESGDDLLLVNSIDSPLDLYGNALLEEAGPELIDGDKELSNLAKKRMGTPLATVEDKLEEALFDLVVNGKAKLESDEDWLTIELNSNMLFPSGSATVTNAAKDVIKQIAEIIYPLDNFVRVRGYTDNEPINSELIASNWHLSALRSTAILELLVEEQVQPARLAIEAYGEFSPFASNDTEEGRAQNRKVVIAISKYGAEQAPSVDKKIDSAQQLSEELDEKQ